MLTWALARRLSGTGTTANAMHPGFVATEIFGKGGGLVSLLASLYSKLRGRRPEEGADTVVWLAASPDVENRSGLFWIDRQERRCRFRDEAGEEALWALCRDMHDPRETRVDRLDLGDVEFERRPYRAVAAYSQSKQADRMLTWALARRLKGSGVSANAMSPGPVATGLTRKGGRRVGLVASLLARLRARTPRRGADTVAWLAASPEIRGRSGGFWFDRREIPCEFRDEAGEQALWALCRDMTRPA